MTQTGDDADESEPLLYGWYQGALVTLAMEPEFKAKRAATRVTVLCFHVATRLSNERGTPGQQVKSVECHVPRANGCSDSEYSHRCRF